MLATKSERPLVHSQGSVATLISGSGLVSFGGYLACAIIHNQVRHRVSRGAKNFARVVSSQRMPLSAKYTVHVRP